MNKLIAKVVLEKQARCERNDGVQMEIQQQRSFYIRMLQLPPTAGTSGCPVGKWHRPGYR